MPKSGSGSLKIKKNSAPGINRKTSSTALWKGKPARNSYKANPFLTAGENDIEKRKEELYILTAELAELWDCRHTRVLHCLYNVLEKDLGIVPGCYKSVYCSETGREDACMAEVIAFHDWIYKKAVKMCEYAIDEKKIFK